MVLHLADIEVGDISVQVQVEAAVAIEVVDALHITGVPVVLARIISFVDLPESPGFGSHLEVRVLGLHTPVNLHP